MENDCLHKVKSSLFTKQTDKLKSRSTTYDSSFRKNYSPKTAKTAKWYKKKIMEQSNISTNLMHTIFPLKFTEASSFLFLKKKRKQVFTQMKKKKIFFFCFSLKDNFLSPPHTSKEKLSTIKKYPSEDRKKCFLANTYANESVGRPQKNNFSFFIPFWNSVFFGVFCGYQKKISVEKI